MMILHTIRHTLFFDKSMLGYTQLMNTYRTYSSLFYSTIPTFIDMKKIAVFFKTPGAMGHPFSKQIYWDAYRELSHTVAMHGGELYITREQHTYEGSGAFSRSWVIQNGTLLETGPVTVDVVYDKGRFLSDGHVTVFNCEKIKRICDDKWLMYQQFSSFCPPTFFATNIDELHSILPSIRTALTVFKPFTGSEGAGVKIEKKEYFINTKESLTFPAIVSEFLDTSSGIPGIMSGTHDLRLAVFDGEILFSFFRTPPQDSFISSVAQGGAFQMIDPGQLPSDVVGIAMHIDATLHADIPHRFYSIDFGYTTEGPKVIEMNSEVALFSNEKSPAFETLKHRLAEVFMNI